MAHNSAITALRPGYGPGRTTSVHTPQPIKEGPEMQTVVRQRPLTAIALAGVAVLAAGCGSSGAKGSTPTTPSQIAQAAKYTKCLRQHGLADFPDPKQITENGTPTVTIAFPAGSTNAPQFNAATGACNHLYPSQQGGNRQIAGADVPAHMLAFARCVRKHGVADFPDPPTPGPGRSRKGPPFSGVNWRSPTVQAAAKACVPASHGVVTPELLQRFEHLTP
jgi:hypothetical protein